MWTLVIARYKEDISWSDDVPNKIVYDKSGETVPGSLHVPNVGREAETYIRYIVEYYDSLPDHVVFVQGNPFDHMSISSIEPTFSKYMTALSPKQFPCFEYTSHYPGLCIKQYWEHIFGTQCPDVLQYSPGCQYTVPRECILVRPKEFYQKIQRMLQKNTTTEYHEAHWNRAYDPESITAWTMERLFPFIFSY